MAGVTRTGKQGVFAVYLSREEHAVPVVWQECVFHLVEGLEICGPCYSDGWAVIAVAPCNVEFILDLGHARVISVYPFSDLRISSLELDGFRVDVPLEAVLGKSCMECHPAVLVIAAEDSGKSVLERNYGRVEYAVGVRQKVARYYRIFRITPKRIFASCGAILPR